MSGVPPAVPSGWTATTLGALGRYVNGRGFRRGEWGESGRPIIRIQNLTGSGARFHHFPGDVDERHLVRAGDLLMAWSAPLGAYLWDGPEAVVNQHIFKVESRIDRRFHKYLLDYKLDELMRHTHGSGMVHITRSRFHAVPVAVPGPDEQRRIVGRLEALLGRLATADAHLASAAGTAAALGHAALLSGAAVHTAPLRELAAVLAEPLANGRSGPGRTRSRTRTPSCGSGPVPSCSTRGSSPWCGTRRSSATRSRAWPVPPPAFSRSIRRTWPGSCCRCRGWTGSTRPCDLVDRLDTARRRLAADLDTARDRATGLRRALLAAAFTGSLPM